MALRPQHRLQGLVLRQGRTQRTLGAVTVSLVNNKSGKAVATARSPAITTDWKQYEFTLKTGAIEAPRRRITWSITVGHAGTLWLNLVSLFPPTYHDRAQRQSHRPDGEAGRDASGLSALSRRQLPRGRPHHRAVRVEEDDRPAGGPADAPQPVELPLDRTAWDCWSFWSGART